MPDEVDSWLYRADDLVECARQFELDASRRLIVDWSGLGLLDRPQRRGLGRGKGSVALWPRVQAELFIDLLTLRQRPIDPVRHVAGLANLPVLGWVYSYRDIPLRQTRRAMATWCGRHRRHAVASADDARRAARTFVKTVEHPHATVRDRAQLRKLVERSLRARTFDRDALHDAVRRVFDPHDEDRRAGPEDVPLSADLFVRLAEARFTAIVELDDFTDRDYELARVIYQESRAGYAKDQPRLAGDPLFGVIFQRPDFERQLNSACVDLLTILGMSRLAPDGFKHMATTSSEQQPQPT